MNKHQIKGIIFIILLGLSTVSILIISVLYFMKLNTEYELDQIKIAQENEVIINDNSDLSIEIEDTSYIYENLPITKGGHYFELNPVIDQQQSYIAHPKQIDTNDPPTIIIYNHGSDTTVTTDFQDQFMLDIRGYGEFFTQKGYIFAASNQHGKNYGNQDSVNDTISLIAWIKENYATAEKIHHIGYSMGGLPAMNHTTEKYEVVN